jgi:alpha-beta hydrolase superfamily lysophospholipase
VIAGPLLTSLLAAGALLAVLGAAIAFGGPTLPAPLPSVNDPFTGIDLSDLPPTSGFAARDGQFLLFRRYAAQGALKGSVTLIHGSSASSQSMHPLAKAVSAAGFQVFALDVRGHGGSGNKGHIDHIGQLEEDLVDFVASVSPTTPSMLVGFSSGGGFVLRFAASKDRHLFASYLLLSPFLSQDAPNYRPGSGGWVSVGIPRIVGLSLLNSVGIRSFNSLHVTSFALTARARSLLTPHYDFNLATNFRPDRDYVSNIKNVDKPCSVLAGTDDEAFLTDRLEGIFREAGKECRVTLLAGVGHIGLTLEPSALSAVVQEVRALQNPDAAATVPKQTTP